MCSPKSLLCLFTEVFLSENNFKHRHLWMNSGRNVDSCHPSPLRVNTVPLALLCASAGPHFPLRE